MKTIGLIGGLTWESTQLYYQIINQTVRARLGGTHSARVRLWSFDFAEIAPLAAADEWDQFFARFVDAAQWLEKGGADCLLICANTAHIAAPAIQQHVDIPLLNIIDVTAHHIKERGLHNVTLLGTSYTLGGTFYKDRMKAQHNLNMLIPDRATFSRLDDIILSELAAGVVNDASRRYCLDLIANMAGSEGVVLACTEFSLMFKAGDLTWPVFDTTALHAVAAVDWALSK